MAINALEILEGGLSNTLSNVGDFTSDLSTTQIAIGTAVAGAVVGGGVVGIISKVKKRKVKRKTKKKKKRTTKKKRKGRKLKFGSPAYRKKYLGKGRRKKKISPKYARTAGKRRDTSRKRIRMTKHGQPYIILANGRARFIKKSSAKRSRKLKGGRY